MFKRLRQIAAMMVLVGLGLGPAKLSYGAASCTPGIPCTIYDIIATPAAGIDPTFNAWKSGASPSASPAFSNGTCDGNYMNQMIGEAFSHAQREILMNAQIIRRPDSVLEYTCFDQYLPLTATYGGTFTETLAWQNKQVTLKTNDETVNESYSFQIGDINWPANISTASHVDNALAKLLLPTLNNYITKNFAHTYLGGSSGVNSNMNLGSIGSPGYSCAHMKAVWDLAKCVNFGEDDNFLSFGQLIAGDPRQLPHACSGRPAPALNAGAPPPMAGFPIATGYITALDALGVMTISETDPCPAAGSTGLISKDIIRLSNNCELKFAAQELARHYLEYTVDPWYVTDLIPAALSSVPTPAVVWGNPCGPPIPTGVRIFYYYITQGLDITAVWASGMDTAVNVPGAVASALGAMGPPALDYEEHVCTNPSCSFVPGLNICAPPPP